MRIGRVRESGGKIKWAHRSAGVEVLASLLKAVHEHAKRTQTVIEPTLAGHVSSGDVPSATGNAASTKEDVPVLLKRSALVAKHRRNWPTIESNLNHCNENGLSAKAKAGMHGYWRDANALQWALENGQLSVRLQTLQFLGHDPFNPLQLPEL